MATSAWTEMRVSAALTKKNEPFVAPLMDKYVLTPSSFGSALATLLSHQFQGDIAQSAWQTEFDRAAVSKYETDSVDSMCLADLTSILARDPACEGLVHAFLNFKGFRALAAHRMAHVLWRVGRREVALAIQSRCSELYGVDIHPAARIGAGLMIDHATGIVIGETCNIGTNCSFLHGVTLGSSGKDKGLRHPQIGNDVLIGCNASVLGYIQVGDNCKIGSGSIVLKPVPTGATAVGNPARLVGASKSGVPAAASMDLALHDVFTLDGRCYQHTWANCAAGTTAFAENDTDKSGYLNKEQTKQALHMLFKVSPPSHLIDTFFAHADSNADGLVNKCEFDLLVCKLSSVRAEGAFAGNTAAMDESKERDHLLWNLDLGHSLQQ